MARLQIAARSSFQGGREYIGRPLRNRVQFHRTPCRLGACERNSGNMKRIGPLQATNRSGDMLEAEHDRAIVLAACI